MIRKMRIVLLVSAVLLLALAFVRHHAKAAQTGTSRGATLIVLGCGQDPNNTQVFGPGSVGPNGGWCDSVRQWNNARLPSGTVYNLRAIVGGGTSNPTPATFKVTLYAGSSIPVLVCEASTRNGQCQDLAPSASLKAGDSGAANISIPDCHTRIGAPPIT